jgi:N-acetylmuramoyl-L-alanine amidase
MKKCALVIGHKKSSPGAQNNAAGLTEFHYNDLLSMDIENTVEGVEVQRIYRRTYDSLPADINAYDPDFIISLHCNAFNEKASGTEVLYYHRSQKGKKMADILNNNLVHALGLKDRGIKAKTVEDRGGYLLKMTNAPCVIAEPFFIDNDDDFKVATEQREALVAAYAGAIEAIAEAVA